MDRIRCPCGPGVDALYVIYNQNNFLVQKLISTLPFTAACITTQLVKQRKEAKSEFLKCYSMGWHQS